MSPHSSCQQNVLGQIWCRSLSSIQPALWIDGTILWSPTDTKVEMWNFIQKSAKYIHHIIPTYFHVTFTHLLVMHYLEWCRFMNTHSWAKIWCEHSWNAWICEKMPTPVGNGTWQGLMPIPNAYSLNCQIPIVTNSAVGRIRQWQTLCEVCQISIISI